MKTTPDGFFDPAELWTQAKTERYLANHPLPVDFHWQHDDGHGTNGCGPTHRRWVGLDRGGRIFPAHMQHRVWHSWAFLLGCVRDPVANRV